MALATIATLSGTASANPEPSLYDARAVGLAGMGVAFIDNPSAVFHNPANIQSVETFGTSIAASLIVADIIAPVEDPDDETHTGISFGPALLLSGAYRVHPRVVVGVGAYINTAFGASFDDVDRIYSTDLVFPEDQTVFFFAGEVAFPVSIRLADNLRLGIAGRLSYARQGAKVTQEILLDQYRPVDQTVSGFGRPGVLVGVDYRPLPSLRIGAVYRSKVKIPMSGTTAISFTQADPLEIDTTTTWYTPHMARLGITGYLMDERLMLATEARLQLHEDANDVQVFEQDLAGFEEVEVNLGWQNTLSIGVAAEYWKSPGFAIRGGTGASNSASREETVQLFTPPPSMLYGVYAGLGWRRAGGDIDLGVSFNWGFADVPDQPGLCQPGERVKIGCAGRYGVTSSFIAVSYTRQ